MAIRKNAKNMTITVKSDYNLTVGGKLEKNCRKNKCGGEKRKLSFIKQQENSF